MNNDEILENYRKATQQYIDFFMRHAEPELLTEVNSAIKSGKCGLIVEVSSQPFGVALKITNNTDQVLLSAITGKQETEH